MSFWKTIAVLIFLASGVKSSAQATVKTELKLPPGPDLCVRYRRAWTAAEREAWTSICRTGRVEGAQIGGRERVIVSSEFLQTVLSAPPYRDVTATKHLILRNIDIVGSELDLSNIELPAILLQNFSSPAISFSGSTIDGDLSLILGKTSILDLARTHVKGSINTSVMSLKPRPGHDTDGTVYGDSAQIDGNVFIGYSNICGIDFANTRVGGKLLIAGTDLAYLDLKGMSITGDVRLTKGTFDRNQAYCISRLNVNDGLQNSPIMLNQLQAASSVDFSDNKFMDGIDMSDATIDRSVVLTGAIFLSFVNLSNSHIGQSLRFAEYSDDINKIKIGPLGAHWGENSSLSLNNATIGDIFGPKLVFLWPNKLDLQNMRFNNILRQGPRPVSGEQSDIAWFPYWLSKSNAHPFNPQPYEQIRNFLANSGEQEASTAVGITENNFERDEACEQAQVTTCIFKWASWAIIGYGYRLWLAAAWSAGFILLGAIVFRRTPEARAACMPHGYAYSFDIFLPLIRLRERHYKIEIDGQARYYFYAHKLAGWILGSFIIAAVSGLTK